MMRYKGWLLTLGMMMAVLLVTAQPHRVQGLSDNQRLLGYVETDSITISGVAFGQAGTFPVGAILDANDLAPYAGCRVVGIRMAASMDLGRARTFIYTITETDVTPVIEQKQHLYPGWNNVFFNGDGYLITGNEYLFFGFDYTETAEMVAAEEGGLCCYGEDTEGAFYTYADFGSGQIFYSLGDAGCLCVQLIVDVSSLPKKDLDMTAADTGFKYKKAGEKIDVMATCRNVGQEAVGAYRLGCQLDNLTPVFFDKNDSIASGRSGIAIFEFSLPEQLSVGTHQLRVFATHADGQPLPSSTARRDTVVSSFAIYENQLNRSKAYLEIYTDQSSPYTPFLNDAVALLTKEDSPLANAMAVVNVHRPGTPLALAASNYLHEYYAYTWPTFTVNRSYFPGEPYIAYDMNDYLPVIGAEMSSSILGDLVWQDYSMPTFATLGLSMNYERLTRQMTITSVGKVLPEAEAIYGELALTLMVTENNVKGLQAEYNPVTQRTSINQEYLHNQVLRQYITSPIGEAVQVADGQFNASHSFKLDYGWNANEVAIVGILTKKVDQVTNDNLLDVDVIDCNVVTLKNPSGIETVSVQSGDDQIWYSLGGTRVDASSAKPGIYVKDGKKVVVRRR